MGVGASEWASGSQVCTGNSPTLVPNPNTARTNASLTGVGGKAGPADSSGANARS